MKRIFKIIPRVGRWGIQFGEGVSDFSTFTYSVFASLRNVGEVQFRSLYTTIVNQAPGLLSC
ncbi:MAG TPA: hypothetical protein VF857_01560 [Spirochaetota bacterium]